MPYVEERARTLIVECCATAALASLLLIALSSGYNLDRNGSRSSYVATELSVEHLLGEADSRFYRAELGGRHPLADVKL